MVTHSGRLRTKFWEGGWVTDMGVRDPPLENFLNSTFERYLTLERYRTLDTKI